MRGRAMTIYPVLVLGVPLPARRLAELFDREALDQQLVSGDAAPWATAASRALRVSVGAQLGDEYVPPVPLLGLTDWAGCVGASPQSARRWAVEGRIPARKVNGGWLVPADARRPARRKATKP